MATSAAIVSRIVRTMNATALTTATSTPNAAASRTRIRISQTMDSSYEQVRRNVRSARPVRPDAATGDRGSPSSMRCGPARPSSPPARPSGACARPTRGPRRRERGSQGWGRRGVRAPHRGREAISPGGSGSGSPSKSRLDPSVAIDVHHRDHDLLDLRRDLDRFAEERPDHPAELLDGHAGEMRWSQPLLRGRPVHLSAERADAAVHEHGAPDHTGPSSRELERHRRAPRVTDDDRSPEGRRPDDGTSVGHDRVEAVPARGLRGQAVPTRVVRDDPEAAGQAGKHQIPNPLRRGEAMKEEETGRRGRGGVVDPDGEPDAPGSGDVHFSSLTWLVHTRRAW